jgi:hypothetical protein
VVWVRLLGQHGCAAELHVDARTAPATAGQRRPMARAAAERPRLLTPRWSMTIVARVRLRHRRHHRGMAMRREEQRQVVLPAPRTIARTASVEFRAKRRIAGIANQFRPPACPAAAENWRPGPRGRRRCNRRSGRGQTIRVARATHASIYGWRTSAASTPTQSTLRRSPH